MRDGVGFGRVELSFQGSWFALVGSWTHWRRRVLLGLDQRFHFVVFFPWPSLLQAQKESGINWFVLKKHRKSLDYIMLHWFTILGWCHLKNDTKYNFQCTHEERCLQIELAEIFYMQKNYSHIIPKVS